MSSLRRRLTVALWIALGLVGLASTSFAYWQALSDTNELLDHQMEQVAGLLGRQPLLPAGPGANLPNVDRDLDPEDRFEVTIRNAAGVEYTSTPNVPLPVQRQLGFTTAKVNGEDFRVFSAMFAPRTILVAQRTGARREIAASAALSSLMPVGLMLPVLALIIGLVIRRELRPLRSTAEEVSRRRPLALKSLPIAGLPSEVLPLVIEINRLLERMQAAVEREQRFITDAAHALRTPLAALQLQADVLGAAADRAENAERIADLRAGIRRALRLSDHLLALARTEPGTGAVRGRVDLDEAAAEACALYTPAATMGGIQLRLEARSEAQVPGDTRFLALLLNNLIDNAIRYTPSGGTVVLDTRVEAGGSHIRMIDEGPGLPESELNKVLERFYRAPGNTIEGSGLGLAVVRGIADRLGGRAWLENRNDRSGLVAHVWLPNA